MDGWLIELNWMIGWNIDWLIEWLIDWLAYLTRLFEEIEELTAKNLEKDKREMELVQEIDKLRYKLDSRQYRLDNSD